MAIKKKTFNLNSYVYDPARQRFMIHASTADRCCEYCGYNLWDGRTLDDDGRADDSSLCLACNDAAVVLRQAGSLILDDGGYTGLVRPHEANLLVMHPEKVIVNCPCKREHAGVRYAKTRQCVSCMDEAIVRNRDRLRKKKGQQRKSAALKRGSKV